MAEFAEDTAAEGALPDEASSDADGVRSDEAPAKVGDLTLSELASQLATAPEFYDALKGHVQRETQHLKVAVDELKEVAGKKWDDVLDYVGELKTDGVRQSAIVRKLIADMNLDPKDAEAAAEAALEVHQQQTTLRRLQRQVEAKEAPKADAPAASVARDLWTAMEPDIVAHAERRGVNYDAVSAKFPRVDVRGMTTPQIVAAFRKLEGDIKGIIDTAAKGAATAAKPAARVDTARPGGAGAKDYSKTAVSAIPNDEFEDNFEAIARATVARVRGR